MKLNNNSTQGEEKAKYRKLTNNGQLVKVFSELLHNLQKLEEDQYNMKALYIKQLHMRQMMNLKTRGRYLEETKIFEKEIRELPS